jgi:hypothetical protein
VDSPAALTAEQGALAADGAVESLGPVVMRQRVALVVAASGLGALSEALKERVGLVEEHVVRDVPVVGLTVQLYREVAQWEQVDPVVRKSFPDALLAVECRALGVPALGWAGGLELRVSAQGWAGKDEVRCDFDPGRALPLACLRCARDWADWLTPDGAPEERWAVHSAVTIPGSVWIQLAISEFAF